MRTLPFLAPVVRPLTPVAERVPALEHRLNTFPPTEGPAPPSQLLPQTTELPARDTMSVLISHRTAEGYPDLRSFEPIRIRLGGAVRFSLIFSFEHHDLSETKVAGDDDVAAGLYDSPPGAHRADTS